MKRHLADLVTGSRSHALALVLFAWLSFTPSNAWAGTSVLAGQRHSEHGSAGAGALVVAIDWWEKLYHPLELCLSSRAGMIQFGAIMAALALVIIWWRRT